MFAWRGYSLVELLITLAVLSLLLGLGVPSYRQWIQNSQVRTAAESVLNGLQLARAEAARRNVPVSFTVSGNDWSVDVVANANYSIPASMVQQKSGAEGTRNAVIAANPVSSVVFNGTGRVTPIPASDITFSVSNPTAGSCTVLNGHTGVRCLRVVVSPSGQVRMCDPAMARASNPQGC